MDKKLLLDKLGAAERELGEAERALEKTLGDLGVTPRAEKKAITQVVETAFERLRSARKALSELEHLLTAPD
jgi:hypothetical protein